MPDRTTLNLIGAAVSLVGSLRAFRQANSTMAKLKTGIGLATSLAFLYSAYQKRSEAQLA